MNRIGLKNIEKRLTAWLTCMYINEKQNNNLNNRNLRLPTFITLTLSDIQKHSDKEIKKKMLELFLKTIRYQFDVKHYFWKCEKKKNDRLHIHLIVDRYIPAKKIQKIWNKIQEKNGYINKYYEDKGHKEPPSTHVKGINEFEKKIGYVMKYVRKETDDKIVEGSLYRFSHSLLTLKPFSFSPTARDLPQLQAFLSEHITNEFCGDWFSVYNLDTADALPFLDDSIRLEYHAYYENMYNDLYCISTVTAEKKDSASAAIEVDASFSFPTDPQTSLRFPLS